MKQTAKKKPFLQQHSLSASALGVVILLIVLYTRSEGEVAGQRAGNGSGALVL